MATYAVGDIQGCFDELQTLLQLVNFGASDHLWVVGDLVNRGPKSLATLRFIRGLGNRAKVVLGNHDLHLLAVYYSSAKLKKSDTLQQLLNASDCAELMLWLKSQPLVHFDTKLNALMVHAGIPAHWTVKEAISRSREVENALQGPSFTEYFQNMYGNTPSHWQESLSGHDRLRCITNTLTRMRFCHQDRQLDLSYKGDIGNQPAAIIPWFDFYQDPIQNSEPLILFGHWAALMGNCNKKNIIALDTGCVWGEKLTAICIETRQIYSTPSLKK